MRSFLVSLALTALSASSVAAFSSPVPAFTRSTAVVGVSVSLQQANRLNEIDTMCIMNIAEYCATEDCSLEDREALTARVQEQRDIIAQELHEMEEVLDHLKNGVNGVA